MTTTHDLPTVAGWWRGERHPHAPRARLRRGVAKSEERRARIARGLWQAFTDAGVAAGARRRRTSTGAGRRCGARLSSRSRRRRCAGAARGPAGPRGAAQPAGHDRRASQLAPPPRACRRSDLFDAPDGRRRAPAIIAGASPMIAARHPAAAVPSSGFTFADAEALVPYFARLGISHLYASPIAIGAAGLDARLRRHRSDAGQSGAGRRGGAARAGRRRCAAAGLGLIVDIVPNHMAADTGERLVGRRAAPRPRQPLCPLLRHRLGRPTTRSCCRSSASRWRRRWPAGEIELRARRRCATSRHRLPLAPGERELAAATCWSASTIASPGGAARATASTGGASSTSTSWSACAWRTTRRSRRCMPAAPALCRGADRRRAGRPCRWPGRSGGLLPDAAPAARATPAAWLVVEKILLRGETLAARLGLRRHHRLRLHGRGERAAARPRRARRRWPRPGRR